MSDKTSDKLLKCPFCGGEASLETISNLTRTEYVVCCDNKKCICFYIGYGDVGLYETKEKAIEAWNQRKPMERILERLEEYRDDFMDDIYEELREDTDNLRANRIIDRFDEAIEIVKEEGGLNE